MIDNALLEKYNQSRETSDKNLICHAPFVSLNFEQNGNVTACCYNRTFILGAYPQDSLQEIWTGDQANQLREYIQANDLTHGCELCLHQLESGNFSGMRATGYDAYAQKENGLAQNQDLKPRVFEFELSNTCNLECIMCNGHFSSSIRKNREQLPPKENPYNADFVTQLEAFMPDLEAAKFLGGEPFLIDMYYDIWDRMIAINPNIKLKITTNGTILNQKVKDTLEVLKSDLIISIDSVEKETYEAIRQNASYERVMENLEYFIDYTKRHHTNLSFAVCPIQKNWKEIPNIVAFCNQRGIHVFFNTVLFPIDLSLRRLGKLELEIIATHLQEHAPVANSPLGEKNLQAYDDLVNQINLWQENAPETPNLDEKVFTNAVAMFDHSEGHWKIRKEIIELILATSEKGLNAKRQFHIDSNKLNEFTKVKEKFADSIRFLLKGFDTSTSLKIYLEVLKIFHEVAFEYKTTEKEKNTERINLILNSLQVIPSLERMFDDAVSMGPVGLLHNIMRMNLEEKEVIPFLVTRYQETD